MDRVEMYKPKYLKSMEDLLKGRHMFMKKQ